MFDVSRRRFVVLLGGAGAAWPLVARAQQPAMPVIGFLSSGSADAFAHRVRAFHQGLREAGYVEGENVTTLYRWAEGQNDRLPAQADDLVRRRVAVIAAFGSLATSTARKASAMTPIVFAIDEDPVRLGLVASLSRPGGNLTGANFFANDIVAKRLGLQIDVLKASTSGEIDAAFAGLARDRPDALFVAGDPFFSIRRIQLVNMASRHGL